MCLQSLFPYESGSEVAQSCPILWDLMDCSLPGSSVPGIFQARELEWVAISFSKENLPNPGIEHVSPALWADTLPSETPGKPIIGFYKKLSITNERRKALGHSVVSGICSVPHTRHLAGSFISIVTLFCRNSGYTESRSR